LKLKETIVLEQLDSQKRLSDALISQFESIPSRKGIKKAIQKGLVKINGKIATTGIYVTGGETVELFFRSGKKDQKGYKLKLEVLFEDEFLAIINKPSGIVVSGNQKRTIRNALINEIKSSNELDNLRRPEPVHRLDYATSGLLIVAKTHNTMTKLNQMFEARQIQKTYVAIVFGDIAESGEIDEQIKSKTAVTKFKKLKTIPSDKYANLSLVELQPTTGRKHQLRIHLEGIGHPIIGDHKYPGQYKSQTIKGLHLHASNLSFKHPVTDEEISIEAELPKKFAKWI